MAARKVTMTRHPHIGSDGHEECRRVAEDGLALAQAVVDFCTLWPDGHPRVPIAAVTGTNAHTDAFFRGRD